MHNGIQNLNNPRGMTNANVFNADFDR